MIRRITSFLSTTFLALAVFSEAALVTASAESYFFTKIADSNSLPLSASTAAPVIDGDFIVFLAKVPSGALGEMWSYQISTKKLQKLIGSDTLVPGTLENFADLNAGIGGPFLRDGTVVFGGSPQGSGTPSSLRGIYTIAADGGPIHTIANHSTTVPGTSTTFDDFDSNNQSAGNFSVSRDRVVFQGSYSGGIKSGIFVAYFDGTGLSSVVTSDQLPAQADPTQNDFHYPSIFNTTAAYFGGTPQGGHAIYTTSLPILLTPPTLLTTPTLVMSDTYSRFGGTALPILGTQYKFRFPGTALQLNQNSAVFLADGAGQTLGHSGIFAAPIHGGAIQKIVTDAELTSFLIPEQPVRTFPKFESFTVDGSDLLFRATDSTGKVQGLFVAGSGLISPVIYNDQITPSKNTLGFPISDLVSVQPGALSSGKVVFAASSSSGPQTSLYLGTPNSQLTDLQLSVQTAPPSTPMGSNLTFILQVKNNGPATAKGIRFSAKFPNGSLGFANGSVAGIITKGLFSGGLSDIPSGATSTITLGFSTLATGSPEVTFSTESGTIDPNESNNTVTIATSVGNPLPTTPTELTPSDIVRGLLNQASTALKTAKLTLPPKPSKNIAKKKKVAINARRHLILTARATLKSTVAQIVAQRSDNGTLIQFTITGFTATNVAILSKSVNHALAAPSAANWKAVQAAIVDLSK